MLNTKQQLAYDTVINSKDKIVLLLGEAGSGKSFTTAAIIKDYPGSVAITATTNKAKEIIGNMALTKAYTTHSFSGFTMVRSGKSQHLAQVRESDYADLVVVEEVTMLPQTVWLSLQRELEAGTIKQLLLLGDEIQLPAVGIGIDINKLKATKITLTEQMRQDANNSELSTYFSEFRKAIKTKDYNFNPLSNLPSCITVQSSFSKFVKQYKNNNDSSKILAYSNSVVDKYNTNINGGKILPGDTLVLNKPLDIAKNGDTITAITVKDKDKFYTITTIVNGVPYTIYHYKTKSALEEYLAKARNDTEYWDMADLCFNLKHQYSCTVHKSQGSTYNKVFIDHTDILAQLNKKPTVHNNYAKPISYNTYLRLLYVALSRMKESATIFTGSTRNYKLLRSKNE